jgi:pimeloyl-ACP methyl ester carboxylesterase
LETRPWAPQHRLVDGHRLAYVRCGTGEPLILIHGITTSSFIWDDLLPILSVHHEVIAVDLLGTGASDRPVPSDCSLSAHADRVISLINQLGLEKIHLVGHDIGGGIAQIVSVRNPDRVSTLGLVNSVGYDYWPVQPIVAIRTPILRQLAMASLDLGMLRLVIRRAVHRRERITPVVFERIRNEIAIPTSRRAFLNSTRCLNNSDLTAISDDLQRLEMPVLIVRGDRDLYLSPEIANRLHREIPSSKLVKVPDGGHFIQLDEPQLLAATILEHIRESRHE